MGRRGEYTGHQSHHVMKEKGEGREYTGHQGHHVMKEQGEGVGSILVTRVIT